MFSHFKYVGEDAPELRAWPAAERRKVFLIAVRRSYRRLMTWAGFAAFLALTGFSRSMAGHLVDLSGGRIGGCAMSADAMQTLLSIGGWIVLGAAQVRAIRSELRKMMETETRVQARCEP